MPGEDRPATLIPRRQTTAARHVVAAMAASCLLVAGLPATAADYVQAAGSSLTFATR